jgi:hypothetical protein
MYNQACQRNKPSTAAAVSCHSGYTAEVSLRLVKLPPNVRCANPLCNRLRRVALPERALRGQAFASAEKCRCGNLIVVVL